jgi:putative nucleotidyltransferase with HDIG domain
MLVYSHFDLLSPFVFVPWCLGGKSSLIPDMRRRGEGGARGACARQNGLSGDAYECHDVALFGCAGLLDAPRCVRCKVPAPGGAVAIFGPKDHRVAGPFPVPCYPRATLSAAWAVTIAFRAGIPAGENEPMRDPIPTTHADMQAAPSPRCREGLASRLGRIHSLLRSTQVDSMLALLAAVDAKDSYTRGHSMTVSAYVDAMAGRMDLRASARRVLQASALLHDIGKIGVPDGILNKPGPLSRAEFEVMKRHPQTAVEILYSMRSLSDHRRIILHHHERYDGGGYPSGLRGEDIPLGSRILAVADTVDTMLSRRPYKAPMSAGRVRAELVAQAGIQFDPAVVSVALCWLDDGGHAVEDQSETTVQPACSRS